MSAQGFSSTSGAAKRVAKKRKGEAVAQRYIRGPPVQKAPYMHEFSRGPGHAHPENF